MGPASKRLGSAREMGLSPPGSAVNAAPRGGAPMGKPPAGKSYERVALAGRVGRARARAWTRVSGVTGDFSPMWAGQAASLGRAMPAGELTKTLAAEALKHMRELASSSE